MKSMSPALCFLLLLIVPASVTAQWHEKTSAGETTVRQMNNSLNGATPGYQMPGRANQVRSEGAFIVPTEIQPYAGGHVKIAFKKKMPKATNVWGRAENHTDGTYTETVFDIENQQSDNLVIQHTKKKTFTGEDPIVLTRKISMNTMGQPDEVLIYDGNDRLKYHGKFVYDSMGRLLEEQLRDARGTPLRRTIQRYSPEGDFLPLETYDYVDNLPEDLQIVVTQTDSLEQEKLAELNAMYSEAQKKGLFANLKRKEIDQKARQLQEELEQRNTAAPSAYQGTAPAPSASAKEAGGKKFQLFKFRSRN